MDKKITRILFFVLLFGASVFTVSLLWKKGANSSVPVLKSQKQVNYTNSTAQICSKKKNTAEENKDLSPGLVYVYFQGGYPLANIGDFLAKNNYQIKGEIYSELQGRHSVYMFVPLGEEFCWARELEKVEGVEDVRLPSTLFPD